MKRTGMAAALLVVVGLAGVTFWPAGVEVSPTAVEGRAGTGAADASAGVSSLWHSRGISVSQEALAPIWAYIVEAESRAVLDMIDGGHDGLTGKGLLISDN